MSYAIVSRFLGLLLLTAAGLKAYGVATDPVARSGVFSAPAVQFIIIAFEVALGVWLLSGKQPIGSWLIAVTTFAGFAVVTFYQGVIGQASCGCAGRLVTINPWVAFTVDIIAVAMLVKARPDLQPLWQQSRADVARASLKVAGFAGGALLVLGTLSAAAIYHHGSFAATLARLRNERLSIEPGTVDVGHGSPGETREASVDLTNWTDQPIHLFGGTTDCSCSVIGDMPVTIPPGETRSITVTVRLPRTPGVFTRRAELKIDDQGFRTVGFRLTGQIRE